MEVWRPLMMAVHSSAVPGSCSSTTTIGGSGRRAILCLKLFGRRSVWRGVAISVKISASELALKMMYELDGILIDEMSQEYLLACVARIESVTLECQSAIALRLSI